MNSEVYDGKVFIGRMSRRLRREAENLRKTKYIEVGLGILIVMGDQVAMSDIGKISKLAEESGINVQVERVAQRNIARKFYPTLEEYAASPYIHGIYIPLPLPIEIVPLAEVMRRLPPEKDVGGIHFINRGKLSYPHYEVENFSYPPELPGVAATLKECSVELKGGKVVVIGSDQTSGIVRMLSGYLYEKGANVRLVHYKNLPGTRMAGESRKLRHIEEPEKKEEITVVNPEGEAVVTWTNHAGWLTRERLFPGSVVIDMGYKFARGKISGDCDFQNVSHTAKIITPVPGGARNIVHAMIVNNVIDLVKQKRSDQEPIKKGDLRKRFGVIDKKQTTDT